MDRVISISHSRDSFVSGKSCKDTPDESRVEFKKNLQAKHFASSANDNTSN